LTERDSHRFRSWCFLIQNVYRRSLSSGLDLRKPRVFMIETRKDSAVHVSLSSSSLVKQPGAKTPLPQKGALFSLNIRRRMTTDEDRLFFTHQNEELDGHENSSWPRAKTAPRSVGRVIGPPDLPCQRSMSTNRRITELIFATQRSPDFWELRAVLEPQSCDVLTYRYAMNRRVPVGAAGVRGSWGSAIHDEPVAFSR
jgi:hypothetical protein